MISRQQAAEALHRAELETQRATTALLRGERNARDRWTKAKLAMLWAQERAERVSLRDGASEIPDTR